MEQPAFACEDERADCLHVKLHFESRDYICLAYLDTRKPRWVMTVTDGLQSCWRRGFDFQYLNGMRSEFDIPNWKLFFRQIREAFVASNFSAGRDGERCVIRLRRGSGMADLPFKLSHVTDDRARQTYIQAVLFKLAKGTSSPAYIKLTDELYTCRRQLHQIHAGSSSLPVDMPDGDDGLLDDVGDASAQETKSDKRPGKRTYVNHLNPSDRRKQVAVGVTFDGGSDEDSDDSAE
eukprot:m.118887 g.118887  ORF g.118887 m.118887 type:complete len:235 (+) comp13668_c0_seq1:150-854(+)